MINDLTDEIFWVVTVGLCILFILRLLSPPPPSESVRDRDIAKPIPRTRRRALRRRWHARRRARTVD